MFVHYRCLLFMQALIGQGFQHPDKEHCSVQEGNQANPRQDVFNPLSHFNPSSETAYAASKTIILPFTEKTLPQCFTRVSLLTISMSLSICASASCSPQTLSVISVETVGFSLCRRKWAHQFEKHKARFIASSFVTFDICKFPFICLHTQYASLGCICQYLMCILFIFFTAVLPTAGPLRLRRHRKTVSGTSICPAQEVPCVFHHAPLSRRTGRSEPGLAGCGATGRFSS